MIDRSQIKYASIDVIAKSRRTWIKTLHKYDRFLVTPKVKDKARREVHFLDGGKVLCFDNRTGEICKANSFKTVCYHSRRAYDHRERLKNRNHKRAA